MRQVARSKQYRYSHGVSPTMLVYQSSSVLRHLPCPVDTASAQLIGRSVAPKVICASLRIVRLAYERRGCCECSAPHERCVEEDGRRRRRAEGGRAGPYQPAYLSLKVTRRDPLGMCNLLYPVRTAAPTLCDPQLRLGRSHERGRGHRYRWAWADCHSAEDRHAEEKGN